MSRKTALRYELERIFRDGVPLSLAILEITPAEEREYWTNLIYRPENGDFEEIENLEFEVLKRLQNGSVVAVGKSKGSDGVETLERVRPALCHRPYIDLHKGTLNAPNQTLTDIVAYFGQHSLNVSSEGVAQPTSNPPGAPEDRMRDRPKGRGGSTGFVDAGVTVLVDYVKDNPEWDGTFHSDIIAELNVLISKKKLSATHNVPPVDRRTWANYKNRAWKELESQNIRFPRRWASN